MKVFMSIVITIIHEGEWYRLKGFINIISDSDYAVL